MMASDRQRVFSSLSVGHLTISFPGRPIRPPYVHWDGNRVLFEIPDGKERVPCAISRGALEGLGKGRQFGGAAFVQCFLAARERIEAIARGKLRAMPGGVSGTLNIWAGDLGDLPPSGTPMEAYGAVQRLSA